MTQNEKDLLAKFAESTNKAIQELTSLITIAADQINGLKVRLTDKEEMDEAIDESYNDRLHNLEKFNDDQAAVFNGVWSKYQRNEEGGQ